MTAAERQTQKDKKRARRNTRITKGRRQAGSKNGSRERSRYER